MIEDVEGPLGDDPRDPELYRREAHPVAEKPSQSEVEADEREIWRLRQRYSDGGGL